MMLFLWGVLPVLAFIGMIAYLLWKISGGIDFFCKSISKKRKRIMTIIGLIILLLPAVSVKATWVLVLLHFAVILLVMDLIAWLIHKIWKKKEFPILWKRLYRSGVIAALLTCAVFVYGTYNIYHVIQTDYTVETAKAIREDGYKILVVSDLHYGITLNQEQLQEEVTKMSGENADCDMIVSGHTHGGQIWPAGLFAIALHLDDQSYGEETLNQLHAIVTSGIAGWGFPLRTEKHSEYIVINLKPVNGK